MIEKDSKTRLSREYQNALVNKIKGAFNAEEQQLFVASFYCYLNYNTKTDFVIDFTDVWKWCGFTRKEEGKRLLTRHFVEDIDYKVENFAPPIGGAKNSEEDEKVSSETKEETRGGYNKEKITLTVNTFKKFCMKAGTKKSDQIHDYYVKLEEILQETLKEQTDELQNQLEQKTKALQEQKQITEEKKKELENHSKQLEIQSKKIYDQNYLLRQADLKIKSVEKSKQNLLNRRER